MKCNNCKKHKATENWIGTGNMMSFVHGDYARWCMCCCLKEQIKSALEAVERLNQLQDNLKEVKCK